MDLPAKLQLIKQFLTSLRCRQATFASWRLAYANVTIRRAT